MKAATNLKKHVLAFFQSCLFFQVPYTSNSERFLFFKSLFCTTLLNLLKKKKLSSSGSKKFGRYDADLIYQGYYLRYKFSLKTQNFLCLITILRVTVYRKPLFMCKLWVKHSQYTEARVNYQISPYYHLLNTNCMFFRHCDKWSTCVLLYLIVTIL